MIEQISPDYKFTCDRCGKQVLINRRKDESIPYHAVEFKDSLLWAVKQGQVCETCHKEFLELAENFFDEANIREATEEEIKCKDCKHLMFSDCYGECSKGFKGIVNPNDSCPYGERKEVTECKQ